MHALNPIINGSQITAPVLGELTGIRLAPECPAPNCIYALSQMRCVLPVCRDRWPDTAVRLARWATGRMLFEYADFGNLNRSLADGCERFTLTEWQHRTSRKIFEEIGTEWITAAATGPVKPVQWLPRRTLGRCVRCGGTIIARADDEVKCSMCSRGAAVA